MKKWLAENAVKALTILVIALCLAGLLVVRSCGEARTAKTRENVSKNQAEAATNSGKDAVETLGNRAAAETASADLSRDNADNIAKAEGSTDKVAAPVRNAGRSALCKREAYRNTPACQVKP